MFLKENNIISYIGSKRNLYNFLDKNMLSKYKDKEFNFYDLFSGTASVSQYVSYYYPSTFITGNDINLFSKYLFDLINIDIKNINIEKLRNYLIKIDNEYEYKLDNNLLKNFPLYIFNELSNKGKPETYKENRFYFLDKIAKKIDYIKYKLKKNKNKFNNEEFNILLLMLLNYADRNANTTGVYGAFLKSLKLKYKDNLNDDTKYKLFNEKLFDNIIEYIKNNNNRYKGKHIFYMNNIVDLIKNLKVDNSKLNIFYFDPPYNTRDYQTNYHILNYIVDLNFEPSKDIKYGSKTAVPKIEKRINNPFNSKIKTKETVINIINEIKSKDKNAKIYFSYSSKGLINLNTWKNEILKNYKYNIYSQEYKAYKSKKEHTINTVNEYLIEIL